MLYVNKKVACPYFPSYFPFRIKVKSLALTPILLSQMRKVKNLALTPILLFLLLNSQSWGACSGSNMGTWNTTTASNYSNSNSNFTVDYYNITVTQSGALNLTINNISTGNNNRGLTVSLYPNNNCASTAIWSASVAKGQTTSKAVNVASGAYTLQIIRNNNRTTGYNFSGTFGTVSTNIGERSFVLRNPIDARNLNGGLKVIGNTVLCVKSNGVCYDYAGGSNNNALDLQYIDINTTDTRTYNNSSQARLSIPSTATVKWAALYTQGYLNNNSSSAVTNMLQDPVYLNAPSIGVISLSPDVMDIYANDTDGYTYDTYSEIDAFVGKKGFEINGWITAANIKANTGTENSGLGNFGAWTLVIIYEEISETLKNISIFDGYKKVADETGFQTVDIPISGFVTPVNGIINSTVSIFVGEGDKGITGDKLYVSNLSGAFVAINSTNAFSSVLSGFNANPSFTNNQGIDIQNHQIGVDGNSSHPQIIGNNQKNTTVRMTSTQDAYFPSMVAFITELYVPDMCYEENITKNGTVPTEIFVGDILDFEVLISNKSYEPAQKVSISRDFNDESEYERNSTAVKSANVFQAKTDIVDGDVVTYLEISNVLTLNLGTGATALSGGKFIKDQNETFKFSFEVQEDGNLTNAYNVSYKDDSNITGGSVVYAGSPIGKCSDRNITQTIVPILPSGKVRIVESGKNWNDNSGRLFTKIVNKATQYDTLFATNDTGTTLTTGKIKKLEILNIENQASPVVISTPINSLTTITQRYPISITHIKAYKRLQFRITLEDGSTALSNDFSVRPADVSGTIDTLWAGETLTVVPGNIKARDNALNTSLGYNKTLTASNISSINIDPLKTCESNTTSSLVDSLSVLLIDGQSSSVTALFKDIATNLGVTIKDSDWVASSDDVINADCIVGSSSNIANASGLFGCNIEGNITVTVQPYELNVTDANFTTSIGGDWLYDANVSDMFVTARATVQANNKQHQALQNFTSNCYAQPVDLSFYYDVNKTNDVNLSYAMTSGTMASSLKGVSDINKTITLPASLFTTSSASADYRFNIDRAYNVPLSPIDIALRNVKVTSTTVAKDENNATVNKAARFYYGRIKTKDIVTDKTIAPHLLHVEVYSPTTISGFYQNSLNWYINADDDGTTVLSDGNFSENKAFLNNQPSTSVGVSGTTSFMNGIARFNINNLLEEKGSVVHVGIPTWLWNSTLSDYNNSVGATCVSHPCFDYKYIKDKDTVGIKSGSFKGSTIGNDYNATYQKSGVKTFR